MPHRAHILLVKGYCINRIIEFVHCIGWGECSELYNILALPVNILLIIARLSWRPPKFCIGWSFPHLPSNLLLKKDKHSSPGQWWLWSTLAAGKAIRFILPIYTGISPDLWITLELCITKKQNYSFKDWIHCRSNSFYKCSCLLASKKSSWYCWNHSWTHSSCPLPLETVMPNKWYCLGQ